MKPTDSDGVDTSLRLRGLTVSEVAEVKHGADRSDWIFARNVLLKFCRMHGIVLIDWDGNELPPGVDTSDGGKKNG